MVEYFKEVGIIMTVALETMVFSAGPMELSTTQNSKMVKFMIKDNIMIKMEKSNI